MFSLNQNEEGDLTLGQLRNREVYTKKPVDITGVMKKCRIRWAGNVWRLEGIPGNVDPILNAEKISMTW